MVVFSQTSYQRLASESSVRLRHLGAPLSLVSISITSYFCSSFSPLALFQYRTLLLILKETNKCTAAWDMILSRVYLFVFLWICVLCLTPFSQYVSRWLMASASPIFCTLLCELMEHLSIFGKPVSAYPLQSLHIAPIPGQEWFWRWNKTPASVKDDCVYPITTQEPLFHN